MAVDGYLNRAYSNLARAEQAKQREIADLRADITHKERESRKQIDKLEGKILTQKADLALVDHGPSESAHDIYEIKQMNDEIKEIQRTFDQTKKDLEEQIRKGETLLQEIRAKASDVKSMSG